MATLIVQNSAEGPGLLEKILCFDNCDYTIVDLSEGDSFPDPLEYEAVVVLGGPDSANDQTPKMQKELAAIKNIIHSRVPYLGICLGMQALVKAAGGEVYQSPVREAGWRGPDGNYFTVQLTAAGRADPLFAGLPSSFPVFQLHGETVELTDRMQLLAVGDHVSNQIVKVGDVAYGIQNHLELTPEMFDRWRTADQHLRTLDQWQLQVDYANMREAYEANGRTLFRNFLRMAKVLAPVPTHI